MARPKGFEPLAPRFVVGIIEPLDGIVDTERELGFRQQIKWLDGFPGKW